MIRVDSDLKVEKTTLAADGSVYLVSATVTDAAVGTIDPPLYRISFLWNKNSGKPGLVQGAQKALALAKEQAADDPVIAAVLAAVPTENLKPAPSEPPAAEPGFGESADKPLYVRVIP